MQIKRDIWLAVGVLVLLHLLTAFASIGLLTRMGPALGHIIDDNALSIRAGHKLLAVLAQDSADRTAQSEPDFARFLGALKDNITEDAERPVIALIERRWRAALQGDRAARLDLVAALLQIETINHSAMRAADRRAQSLSSAGAWAVVVLAIFALLLSTVVVSRLHKQLVEPLIELHEVLDAYGAHNPMRRCRPLKGAKELRQILAQVNHLLDRQPRGGNSERG